MILSWACKLDLDFVVHLVLLDCLCASSEVLLHFVLDLRNLCSPSCTDILRFCGFRVDDGQIFAGTRVRRREPHHLVLVLLGLNVALL